MKAFSAVRDCTGGNYRLIWKQAIKRATEPEAPSIPWWKRAIAFLDRVWL